jgi:hypothetical protein
VLPFAGDELDEDDEGDKHQSLDRLLDVGIGV